MTPPSACCAFGASRGRERGGAASARAENESARARVPPGASRFSTLFNVAAIGGKSPRAVSIVLTHYRVVTGLSTAPVGEGESRERTDRSEPIERNRRRLSNVPT